MNTVEKIIVALLFAALLGWMVLQGKVNKARPGESATAGTNEVRQVYAITDVPAEITAAERPPAPREVPATAEVASLLPEKTAELLNEHCRLTVTSKGGGIKLAELFEYPAALDNPTGEVVKLDFSTSPALLLSGFEGFGIDADFELSPSADSRGVELTAKRSDGLALTRRLSFTNGYRLAVSEEWANTGDADIPLPTHFINLGTLAAVTDEGDDGTLAVEIRRDGGRKPEFIEFGVAKLAGIFGGSAGGGCSRSRVPANAPRFASAPLEGSIAWIAARTRFFVQVLTPDLNANGASVNAERADGESLRLTDVSAALSLDSASIAPGETLERSFDYYAGPRKLSSLRALGREQSRIMRFGMWRVFCEGLLNLLNFLYSFIPNYGVAIILLTLLVRLVMLPITKRGAESMRRMQALQPKLKEIQALHKGDPQKLQRETMRIYSENKVNPLSGCLPMFIQLPIFIALFTVLRSAVELRFAPFLWVADLSAPENLFRETLGFGVNFLPIAMAGTMALQSYLTPTAGDPSQQRMMMVMMPLMMLFMFYSFPAALGLYWSTSQLLAIGGLLWQRRKAALAGAAGTPGMEVNPPPKETRQLRRSRER